MYFDKKAMQFVKIDEDYLQSIRKKPEPESISENPSDSDDDSVGADLVGTAEYVSPEVLSHKTPTTAVDLWALGCIIYLFLQGRTPFKDKTDHLIFDKILNKGYKLSDVIFSNFRI